MITTPPVACSGAMYSGVPMMAGARPRELARARPTGTCGCRSRAPSPARRRRRGARRTFSGFLAVDDAARMGRAERAADLLEQRERTLDTQWAAVAEDGPEAPALERLHDVVVSAVLLGAEVDHVHNVLLADSARGDRLVPEPLDELWIAGEIGAQDLQREPPRSTACSHR